jgi:hypothetical protein
MGLATQTGTRVGSRVERQQSVGGDSYRWWQNLLIKSEGLRKQSTRSIFKGGLEGMGDGGKGQWWASLRNVVTALQMSSYFQRLKR